MEFGACDNGMWNCSELFFLSIFNGDFITQAKLIESSLQAAMSPGSIARKVGLKRRERERRFIGSKLGKLKVDKFYHKHPQHSCRNPVERISVLVRELILRQVNKESGTFEEKGVQGPQEGEKDKLFFFLHSLVLVSIFFKPRANDYTTKQLMLNSVLRII